MKTVRRLALAAALGWLCLDAVPVVALEVEADFNTAGELADKFNLNRVSGSATYSEAQGVGVGSTGGVEVSPVTIDTDTTAVYKTQSFSFASGDWLTASAFAKRVDATGWVNFLQVGFTAENTWLFRISGYDTTENRYFVSLRLSPDSDSADVINFQMQQRYGTASQSQTYYYPGITCTLTEGNWYKLTGQFKSANAGTQVTVRGTFEDWGPSGTALVSRLWTYPEWTFPMANPIASDDTVWAGFRAVNESGAIAVDNFSASGPASPPPRPPQTVVLEWEQDVPRLILPLDTRFGTFYVWTEDGTMPRAVDVPESYKVSVKERVEHIFLASGVINILVTDVPTPGATTVYFTDWMGDLQGYAWLGVDRFNKRPDDGVAVSLFPDPSRAVPDIIAETVAHEVGHALGLRHVDPDAASDPDNLEVMDAGYVAGVAPRFIIAVSHISDWQSRLSTHNPVYHLRRYTDGVSHEDLLAQGIHPGTWDQGWVERITTQLDFGASAMMLYNVRVLASDPGGHGFPLGWFDQISLADLSQLEFDLLPDMYMQLLAATSAEGILDVILAIGDPHDHGNWGVQPVSGTLVAYLQAYSESGVGYATLAEVHVTGTPVPEPATLLVLALGGLALLCRRRSASS